MEHENIFQKKIATYIELRSELGPKKAWEVLFEGYPERQERWMKEYIVGRTLAEGFTLAIPAYREQGMDMHVVDISNDGTDAVLEIQRVCPVLALAKEYGLESPCPIICEMDMAATEAAFPDIRGRILARIVEGDGVCVFKYERNAPSADEKSSR